MEETIDPVLEVVDVTVKNLHCWKGIFEVKDLHYYYYLQ